MQCVVVRTAISRLRHTVPKLIPDGHIGSSFGNLLACTDFAMSLEVDANAGETQPGSYDGLWCAHKSPDILYNVI